MKGRRIEMGSNLTYWRRKNEYAKKAKEWIAFVRTEYAQEIEDSMRGSRVWTEIEQSWCYPSGKVDRTVVLQSRKGGTSQCRCIQEWCNLNTVDAAFKYNELLRNEGCNNGKIMVLNFASYKNPGGGFLRGSSAQEESLCHASTLYPILVLQEEYYAWNKYHLNSGLYENRAIVSPDVVFVKGEGREAEVLKCDVITCAAPNWSAAVCRVGYGENIFVLKERIRFLMEVAWQYKPAVFIVGAFGCGVFEQDPVMVATIFNMVMETGRTPFDRLVYAVPEIGKNGETNAKIFKEKFG